MFQFYLATGAREGEVMHAEWTDIDFVEQICAVTEKADWKPKDSEEREIPLPDFLVATLKERMLRSN
jgi:integrase